MNRKSLFKNLYILFIFATLSTHCIPEQQEIEGLDQNDEGDDFLAYEGNNSAQYDGEEEDEEGQEYDEDQEYEENQEEDLEKEAADSQEVSGNEYGNSYDEDLENSSGNQAPAENDNIYNQLANKALDETAQIEVEPVEEPAEDVVNTQNVGIHQESVDVSDPKANFDQFVRHFSSFMAGHGEGVFYVKSDHASLHLGPNDKFEVVGYVTRGEYIHAVQIKDGWVKIGRAKYLKISEVANLGLKTRGLSQYKRDINELWQEHLERFNRSGEGSVEENSESYENASPAASAESEQSGQTYENALNGNMENLPNYSNGSQNDSQGNENSNSNENYENQNNNNNYENQNNNNNYENQNNNNNYENQNNNYENQNNNYE